MKYKILLITWAVLKIASLAGSEDKPVLRRSISQPGHPKELEKVYRQNRHNSDDSIINKLWKKITHKNNGVHHQTKNDDVILRIDTETNKSYEPDAPLVNPLLGYDKNILIYLYSFLVAGMHKPHHIPLYFESIGKKLPEIKTGLALMLRYDKSIWEHFNPEQNKDFYDKATGREPAQDEQDFLQQEQEKLKVLGGCFAGLYTQLYDQKVKSLLGSESIKLSKTLKNYCFDDVIIQDRKLALIQRSNHPVTAPGKRRSIDKK